MSLVITIVCVFLLNGNCTLGVKRLPLLGKKMPTHVRIMPPVLPVSTLPQSCNYCAQNTINQYKWVASNRRQSLLWTKVKINGQSFWSLSVRHASEYDNREQGPGTLSHITPLPYLTAECTSHNGCVPNKNVACILSMVTQWCIWLTFYVGV